ncbi:efflux RND transporter periplasmic adaptor subunit [Nitratifractor sp.]
MQSSKKLLKILIFLIIVALLVIGAVRLVKARKAQEAKIPPAKEYAVSVDAFQAKKGKVKLTLPYIALAQNDDDTLIASKIPARVLMIKKSGETVKKGEVIVRLDDSSLKAKLAAIENSIEGAKEELIATEAALKNLEAIHRRTATLLKVNGASQEQYQNEEVKIATTRAKLASVKAKILKLQADKANIEDSLSYTTIKAPIDGIVSKSFVSPGDLAMPGKPLIKLAATKGTYLLVRLPGRAKSIEFGGREYPLKPLHSTFNGLDEFRADIDRYIPAGSREEVAVVTYEGEGVLLPMDTLLNRDGKSYLFLFDVNDTVRPVPVSIRASGQEGVVVDDRFAGKEIVEAKPDILLRLMGGYPVVREPIRDERKER